MGQTQEQSKQRLRDELSAARNRLGAAEVARRSAVVATQVLAMPAFQTAAHVVLYASIGSEVDPAIIAAAARDLGKRLYYPLAAPDRFEFVAREEGRVDDSDAVLAADARAVCYVVPGLAFDSRGVRLGRGGGWYDRALARSPEGVRVGLAYDFQLVSHLPEASWDIRMHAVASETRVLVEDMPCIGQ